jgi:hypothetical protein
VFLIHTALADEQFQQLASERKEPTKHAKRHEREVCSNYRQDADAKCSLYNGENHDRPFSNVAATGQNACGGRRQMLRSFVEQAYMKDSGFAPNPNVDEAL